MQKNNLPTINEYLERVEAHAFGVFAKSLDHFIATQKEQHELMEIAWIGGDEYMAILMNAEQSALYQFVQRQIEKLEIGHRAEVVRLSSTGDVEFDDFMSRIRRHDWRYGYSDDHRVWSSGDKEQTALSVIARQKGGVFLTVFEYWNKK